MREYPPLGSGPAPSKCTGANLARSSYDLDAVAAKAVRPRISLPTTSHIPAAQPCWRAFRRDEEKPMPISQLILMVREMSKSSVDRDDISTGSDRIASRRLKGYTLSKDINISDDPMVVDAFLAKEAYPQISPSTTVYLMGHSDWSSQTLQGRNGFWCAMAMRTLPPIKHVSILSCSLARDKMAKKNDSALVTQSTNSFAGYFHKYLPSKADVYARVFDVEIAEGGKKKTLMYDDKKNFPALGKREASKLRFYWDGNVQKRCWVEYDEDTRSTDAHSADRSNAF
jgi:hypothetical protein